jgi:hypothetical protein
VSAARINSATAITVLRRLPDHPTAPAHLRAAGGDGGSSTWSFASTTPLVCTVSGSTATIVSAGTCSLTADQAGNGNYEAAPQVGASVVINKATQAITGFTPASPITYSPGGTFALSATGGASGNLHLAARLRWCVRFSSTATIVFAGTCSLTADQAVTATTGAPRWAPAWYQKAHRRRRWR